MSDMEQPQTVDVNGIRLAYQTAGDPQSPAMVLLHALGDDATTWAEVASAFADSYRVYALDLRGHGRSDRPGAYSFELMRDDVRAFIDALGLRRAILIGHSMGGLVAYLLAEQHPHLIDRLVIEDAPAPVPADPPRAVPPPPDAPTPFDWAVVQAVSRQRNAPDPDWLAGLDRIIAPTLVIAGGPGSHLPQQQVAELAARIADARLVTVPAGHEVHANAPIEFIAAVRDFLAV